MESEPDDSSSSNTASNSSSSTTVSDSASSNTVSDSVRPLEEFAPFPYQSLNGSGEITGVNTAWLEMVGYEREAVLGESFTSFLTPDSTERFEREFPRFKARGSVSDVEFEIRRADDSILNVSFSGRVEQDENGEFVRTHCQFRDVTEHRNTETLLRQERNRFRALTGAIPDVVILYDSEGTYEEILTGQTELLVASEGELVGKSVWDVLNTEAAKTLQTAIDRTLRSTEVTSTEYQLTIDGEPKWFEARVAPLTDITADQVVVTARDITARKEQEEELRHTKERFELAIHGANLGVWDWNMETDEVSRHAKLRDMLGYTREEFGGHLGDWEQLVHPDGKERHNEALETHIAENTEYYECDYRLRTKAGNWKWIRNIGKVVEWNPDGSPARAVGIHIDIDTQKRAMQELARKGDQLEALNRVVRHDIRNDMNIIHGWAQELEDHVDEEATKALSRVLDVSKHVIDITEVAREFVETLGDDETVDPEAVSLEKHLSAEIETQRETYPEANITISGDIPRIDVRANEMLSSVFRNLLANAVQHNPSSGPEVTIEVNEQSDSVLITIADDGPGIPDERKTAVFGKGEKGLETEGTGIGLHLVHSLVTGYGGDVWIEDNKPEGAVFNVKLPKAE